LKGEVYEYIRYNSLRITDYGLRITDYGLRITDYGLRITDYGLRITDYGLRITDYIPLQCWLAQVRKGTLRRIGSRIGLAMLLVGVLVLLVTGAAFAAEFARAEYYRLASNEIVDDDLYVFGSEIYIDGVVNGDLYAFGGRIEVNGEVTGDVVAAGGAIVIRGLVGDDVRVAGAGIDILGTVRDDLLIAGGGAGPGGFTIPFQIGGRSVEQGVRIGSAAEIGGDVYIAAGSGEIAGVVGGDFAANMGSLLFGAQVAGDANLRAEEVRLQESALIRGALVYSTPARLARADRVASEAVYQEPPREDAARNLFAEILGWIWRTLLILVGFGLLSWLIMRFAPNLVIEPANTIDGAPVETALYGLAAALLLIFFPLLSALLVMLVWIFWGIFPALVTFTFLFGTLALLWFFSPLVTGFWLGRRIVQRARRSTELLIMLLVGLLVIVILGRIPFIGWLVYLISFVFALGGLLRSSRTRIKQDEDPTAPVAIGL
jgi:hypothetical protein